MTYDRATEALLARLHADDEAEAREVREALHLAPGTLTEVLHHGDYYRRREVPAGHSVSAEELRRFVNGSPYVYNVGEDHLGRMHTELDETGQTFLGWSNFYLEPPTESGHPGLTPQVLPISPAAPPLSPTP